MKRIVIALSALIVALSACKKDDETSANGGNEYRIKSVTEENEFRADFKYDGDRLVEIKSYNIANGANELGVEVDVTYSGNTATLKAFFLDEDDNTWKQFDETTVETENGLPIKYSETDFADMGPNHLFETSLTYNAEGQLIEMQNVGYEEGSSPDTRNRYTFKYEGDKVMEQQYYRLLENGDTFEIYTSTFKHSDNGVVKYDTQTFHQDIGDMREAISRTELTITNGNITNVKQYTEFVSDVFEDQYTYNTDNVLETNTRLENGVAYSTNIYTSENKKGNGELFYTPDRRMMPYTDPTFYKNDNQNQYTKSRALLNQIFNQASIK